MPRLSPGSIRSNLQMAVKKGANEFNHVDNIDHVDIMMLPIFVRRQIQDTLMWQGNLLWKLVMGGCNEESGEIERKLLSPQMQGKNRGSGWHAFKCFSWDEWWIKRGPRRQLCREWEARRVCWWNWTWSARSMTAWQRVRHIAPPEMFSRYETILFIHGQSVKRTHYMAYDILEKKSWRLIFNTKGTV